MQTYATYLFKQDWLMTMDYAQIKAMVEEHFAKILADRKSELDKNGPLLPLPAGRLKRTIVYASNRTSLDDEFFTHLMGTQDPELDQIVRAYELDLNNSEHDRKRLKSLYWKGAVAMMRQVLKYSESLDTFNFGANPLSNMPSGPRLAVKPQDYIQRLAPTYMKEMQRSEAWGLRALNEREDCFEYLTELLGENLDIKSFDIAKARYVKECLMNTPANRKKIAATRGLPLAQQMDIEGVAKLAVGSVNKYLQCYSSFFKWAVSNGYAAVNPFTGMALKATNKKKRDRFTAEQVQMLLQDVQKGKDGLFDNDMKHWGFLISLYTGARLNEVCSLTPLDIKQDTKTGIWYFDINDEEETKRLKTQAANRLVPVHSDLIRLGFLEFVENCKASKASESRLLPFLTYSDKEGWGRKLSRWFNDTLLPKLELKRKGLSFHSLRHTVITSLRHSGVDNHDVRSLVGHEPEGVTESVYTHDQDLQQLQKAIERLQYKA
jgi:integrase